MTQHIQELDACVFVAIRFLILIEVTLLLGPKPKICSEGLFFKSIDMQHQVQWVTKPTIINAPIFRVV
jgi:hypothetical protein